jgi:hypothetical protein
VVVNEPNSSDKRGISWPLSGRDEKGALEHCLHVGDEATYCKNPSHSHGDLGEDVYLLSCSSLNLTQMDKIQMNKVKMNRHP